MAKYSSKDLLIDVNAGTNIEAHVLDDYTIGVECGIEESTSFGATWATFISTGVKRGDAFTVGGMYDDDGDGPDAIFNTLGSTIVFITTWGGGKTTTFDAIVQKYVRTAKIGAMTRYVATLQPTGEIKEDA